MRIVSALLPQNEGTVDRVIRVMLGAMMLVLVFVGPRSAWGLVGLLPLATGLLGSCPAYGLFGVSTRRRRGMAHHGIATTAHQQPGEVIMRRALARREERPAG